MTATAGHSRTITTTRRTAPGKVAATAKPSKHEQAIAEYAGKGAHTYTDRRLLDLVESVDRLRSLVQLLVAMMLISFLFGVVAIIAAS